MNAMRVTPEGASFGLKEDKMVASGVMGIGMSWGLRQVVHGGLGWGLCAE